MLLTSLWTFALLFGVQLRYACALPPRKLDEEINTSAHGRAIAVRHYALEVTDKTISAACHSFTSATVFNASSPGPTLRAKAGEILQVRVWNHSQRNTTVHFHGISMRMHPIMDGTYMISQWPITPGSFFDYRIPLTKEDTGTYFYHSHVGLQAMTAYGVLVVEDPDPYLSEQQINDVAKEGLKMHSVEGGRGLSTVGKSGRGSPFAYDEDRILALGDFFSGTSQDIIGAGLEGDPFKWPGTASALLLNGQTSPTPTCAGAYPIIHVQYGKTYRFRFVGATSLMYTSFGILNAKHDGLQSMTLIEADGTYLNPVETDHVEIASGQRYSTLYRSKTRRETLQDGSNGVYWIRIESRWRNGPSMWIKLVHGASVSTDSPPDATQPILPSESFGWLTSSLSPLKGWSNAMPPDSAVTRTVIINTQQIPYLNSKKGIRWAENAALYNETIAVPVPYLVKTFAGTVPVPGYDRAFAADNPWNADAVAAGLVDDSNEERELARRHKLLQGYDDHANVYLAKPEEVIDIVLINKPSALSGQAEIHPWHAHSKKHWTRTIQPGTFSFKTLDQIYTNGQADEYTDPIRRDTTIVYASPGAAYLNQTVPNPSHDDGGWAVLRYKVDANNAGVFVLHCHIHFHLYMGMATIWAIAPDQLLDEARHYTAKNNVIQGVSASGYLGYGGNVSAVQ